MHLLRTTVHLCALMITLGSVAGCSDDDDKLNNGAGGAQATGGTKAVGGSSNRGGASSVGGSGLTTGGSSVIASTAAGSGQAGSSPVTTTAGGAAIGGSGNVAGQSFAGTTTSTGVAGAATGGNGNVAGQSFAGTSTTNAGTAGAAGAAPTAYSISGTVTGLVGSGLALSTGAGTTPLIVSADGEFAFPASFPVGSSVTVSVATQPADPRQTCVVSASGSIPAISQNVKVDVTCTTNQYSVGGAVQGLLGTGLILQNNAGDDLPVAANGDFTFPIKVESNKPFAVSIKTQPSSPTQECTLAGQSGLIVGSDVKTVSVNCASDAFVIGGTVTGLAGTGLVLHSSLGENVSPTAAGSFAFPTAVATGTDYVVTVTQQPTNPLQQCVVTSGGTGKVGTQAVTTVAVTCTTVALRSLSGTVTNLKGSGLVLKNGSEEIPVTTDGFSFATQYPDSAHYKVEVKTNPTDAWQTCSVTNAEGDFAANVTNVVVNCVSNPFTLSVNVTGLTSSGLVLQNNAGNDLAIAAAGGTPVVAAFTTPVLSGTGYDVKVAQQPTAPAQVCKVTAGVGSIANADVTVTVTCADTYAVGGTVYGPVGSGIVLTNGTVDYPISASGAFTLPGAVAAGDNYNWWIKTQPTGGYSCEITGGGGTMPAAAVTTMKVNCPAFSFTYNNQGWYSNSATELAATLTWDNTVGNPTLGAVSAAIAYSPTACPGWLNVAGGFGTALDLTGITKVTAYVRVDGAWPTTDRTGGFTMFIQDPSYAVVAQSSFIDWWQFEPVGGLGKWLQVTITIPTGTSLTQIKGLGFQIIQQNAALCQPTTFLVDSFYFE